MKLPQLYKCTPLPGGALHVEPVAEVQGPEQPLVGESRSGPQPVDAEVFRESGGVGEIVGAAEILRTVDALITKAQTEEAVCEKRGDSIAVAYCQGQAQGLIQLLQTLEDIAEARSDLPNS